MVGRYLVHEVDVELGSTWAAGPAGALVDEVLELGALVGLLEVLVEVLELGRPRPLPGLPVAELGAGLGVADGRPAP